METEPPSVLGMIKALLDVENNILAKLANQNSTGLTIWVSDVFQQLARIYGYNQLRAAFPLITQTLPDAEVPATFIQRTEQLRRIIEDLEYAVLNSISPLRGRRIYIGHGHSQLWYYLREFIDKQLGLPWDEFNRESVAGYTTSDRLQIMLSQAAFAFLIMTAEDEYTDATRRARSNVIHEIGLFQGRLGLKRAIVLLEEGCSKFSNIDGLTYIGFPQGKIAHAFEEVRAVLKREQILQND